jgi:hypothetical protein
MVKQIAAHAALVLLYKELVLRPAPEERGTR